MLLALEVSSIPSFPCSHFLICLALPLATAQRDPATINVYDPASGMGRNHGKNETNLLAHLPPHLLDIAKVGVFISSHMKAEGLF